MTQISDISFLKSNIHPYPNCAIRLFSKCR